jgi:hypothetical protein
VDFCFRWATPYRVLAAPFGVTPRRAYVRVGAGVFEVRFGPWHLETPVSNVAGCDETGGYSLARTAGPAHLSFADRGVTFATNGDRGLCVRFRTPVPALDPLRRIRHPAATVTVEDVEGLAEALRCAAPESD